MLKIVEWLFGETKSCLAVDQFGNRRSPKWPAVRARHLQREPICQACGTKDFLQVHHVRSFHECPELELEEGNLMTLCETPSRNCHLTFGHLYDWRRTNADVRKDAAWWRVERVWRRQD